MTKLVVSLVALLAAPIVQAQATSAAPSSRTPIEMSATGTPGKATASHTVRGTGTVAAVDVAGRTITLQNKSGAKKTFKVGPEAKRLDEIAVGDQITVGFEQELTLEYLPPGSDAAPSTATATSKRTDKDQEPGGATAAGVTATVTVTDIDPGKRLVTLQGPKGKSFQVKAGPKIHLEKLKVGDRLLGTYVEAVAIQLEKPKK
jgi:Cu/Ag efflux protein CusF